MKDCLHITGIMGKNKVSSMKYLIGSTKSLKSK